MGIDFGVLYGTKLSLDDCAAHYSRLARGQAISHRIGIPAATGSNLLIRKSALAAVGGFDLDLQCNEDSEVVWRLKRHGYGVRFQADLAVFATDHRRLAAGGWKKAFTRSRVVRCCIPDCSRNAGNAAIGATGIDAGEGKCRLFPPASKRSPALCLRYLIN